MRGNPLNQKRLLFPSNRLVPALLQTAIHKLFEGRTGRRFSKQPTEQPTGCPARSADHRTAARMSNDRPTHRTGRRSNRATRRRTPGDLATLPLARRRSSLFRHN